jgi:hypothetical protein
MAAAVPQRPAVAAVTSFHPRAPATKALAPLVATYRPDAGLWDTVAGEPGWWQSAVAMDDLIAAERALGTHAYDRLLAQTYWQTPDAYLHEFIRWRGPYYDDTGWWGVMWLDAYRWTGQRRYLVAAQGAADWLERGRSPSCGGGVEWGDAKIRHGSQKNAITDELATTLDAGLYQVTQHPADLRHALASWRWLRRAGLVRPGRLVPDHLDAHCHPVGVRWSYNQGIAIRAGVALTEATGDPGYRRTAASIADAATTSRSLNRHGILREPCAPGRCGHNGAFFAGPNATALAEIGGHHAYLARQAASAYRDDRMVGDRYGLQWSGPPDVASPGRQASAVALLAAVLSSGRPAAWSARRSTVEPFGRVFDG